MAVKIVTRPIDRTRERGATIFIVLLVLTLLSTIGVYAVRAATQVTVASGNNRQATQSLYFAEGAGAMGVAQIGGPQSTLYVDLIYSSRDECVVNAALNANPGVLGPNVRPLCYRIYSTEVSNHVARITNSTGRLYEPQGNDLPGSFGPALVTNVNADSTATTDLINAGRQGLFVIELTDAFKSGSPPAGFNVDDPAFQSVTLSLTAFSQVRNTPNNVTTAEWCGTRSSATTASVQAVRASVILPMVAK